MRAADIAEVIGGTIVGDPDREVVGVSKIEGAGPGDISFVGSPKYAKYAESTNAAALIVDDELPATRSDITYIRTADPYRAFLAILPMFILAEPAPVPGVHPTAVIGENVTIDDEVSIGANVVVGDNCTIGARSVIGPNSVLGTNVSIGTGTTIYANVSLYHGTVVGSRVIIHSGAVLGADGFGFLPTSDGRWEKIPQIGIVVVEDDVEIGANVTIDRATLGRTLVGTGVKIDNLVHVAHNVEIGPHSAIAAQAGVSGSTRIGRSNLIAGQVGIVGHIETVDNVIIEAQSGVSKSIRKAGRYFGHPAKEHSLALRQEGALRQLPDLLQELRQMRERLRQLEAAMGISADGPIE